VNTDNIKMSLKEMGWQGVDWIQLAQGPMAGLCEHDNEPPVSIKGRRFLDQLNDY
jgi:hypothetical protein